MRPLARALAVLALPLLALSGPAYADTIRLSYDDTQADPAETFDEDCLGDAPADDCDARAALIEGELVTLLSRLESDEAPETRALFQAALELDSPLVRAMAVEYLSRADQQPDDFFGKVKTFFLGPDAPLGAVSSAVLQTSSDETDQRLAELFDEQRPASAYAAEPVADTDDFSENRLVQACIADTRIELERSFSEDEQYRPAERLLVYDRFVRPIFDPARDYPVTAYATDAALDEVAAFFTERFGEPLGPLAESQRRLLELNAQLIDLQAAAARGDQQAIAKMQEIAGELAQVQRTTLLDTYLQLSSVHAENDLVWVDGDLTSAATQAVRAVTAGEDTLLGKTVIRYMNATSSPPAGNGGAGSGGAGSDEGDGGPAGAPSNPGDQPADGGAPGKNPGSTGTDSSCGCAIPGAPRGGAAFAALALAAWALRRARGRAAARAI